MFQSVDKFLVLGLINQSRNRKRQCFRQGVFYSFFCFFMNFVIAFRAFFATLFDQAVAQRVRLALSPEESRLRLEEESSLPTKISAEEATAAFPMVKAPSPQQNAAITLLAALQREARFVDFLQEPLAGFSDAQIGAAARTVHDDCAKVLERFFGLQPVIDLPEESPVEVTAKNASLFQLTGDLNQPLPCRGKLIHPGWKATKTDLPTWTGQSETALVIAPSEVTLLAKNS